MKSKLTRNKRFGLWPLVLFAVLAVVGLTEAGTGIRLYTDQQAEAFRARLASLKYPTTPQAACETVGIDLKRLLGNPGLMKSSVDGRVGQSWTQLSENYWISFRFQLYWTVEGSCCSFEFIAL